ncbi:hypothetical protein ACIO14_31435 [Nocardia fluminea]
MAPDPDVSPAPRQDPIRVTTASLAVLRAVDPEQLRAIDTCLPTTP